LDSHFHPNDVFAEQLLPGLEEAGETVAGKLLYRGHLASELPRRLGGALTSVTLLREPRARTLSHLAHIHREERHYLHERLTTTGSDLHNVIADPVLRLALRDVQARYLATDPAATTAPPPLAVPATHYRQAQYELAPLPSNPVLLSRALFRLARMNDFGFADRLDAFASRLARRQGWTAPGPMPRSNVTTLSPWRAEHLTDSDIRLLDQINRVDTLVYRVAMSRARTLAERVWAR
jgi:hypothetical protein